MREVDADRDLLVAAVRDAGAIAREGFQSVSKSWEKSKGNPVTETDLAVDKFLKERLRGARSDYGWLSEETADTPERLGARRLFIVDPIDGTLSFISGVPIYGVMVAVECEGEPVAGVVNLPALGELVAAGRGEGCYWNGRRAGVSSTGRLADALVVCTDVTGMEKYGRGAEYARVRDASRMQRTWGDCYGHILVATGRADVMLDPVMNIWDTAALRPILEEAGGTFTDWAGNATHTAPEAVSTNGVLLDELLAVVASTPSCL